MLYFAPWKKIAIVLVCLLALVTAAPNIFYPDVERANDARKEIAQLAEDGIAPGPELEEAAGSWPSFPSNIVNLGLDLRGGAHLLVEVRIEDVYEERLESLVAEARGALREVRLQGIDGKKYSRLRADDEKVSVRITNPEEIPSVVAAFEELAQPVDAGLIGGGLPDIDVTEEGDQTVAIRMTDQAKVSITDRTMAQSLEIMRRRIDETGTREPTIQRQGERRILIQVPGIGSAEELLAIIGKTAKLNFHLVDSSSTDPNVRPGPGLVKFPSTDDGDGAAVYVVRRQALVTGDRLTDAQPGFDSRTNEPVVNFRFDTAGAKRFGQVTQENVGVRFAIVLDEEVISAPVIREPILGGSGQISGSFSVESASNLAILLRAGALPADITVLEERTVGPDLGQDSIEAGKIACIIAFVAVLIFMVLSYGRFGLFADLALMLNVAMIFAVLSVLGATLTLPGIAGIVLTIGMAVDANVLIFERIREELARSKGVARAVEAGYSRAFSAIIDANVTTLLAAVILFSMGSGPVKGFAVTLGIGIVTSVFAAVVVTRLMVATWLSYARPASIEV